jgi:hypothetical protein
LIPIGTSIWTRARMAYFLARRYDAALSDAHARLRTFPTAARCTGFLLRHTAAKAQKRNGTGMNGQIFEAASESLALAHLPEMS